MNGFGNSNFSRLFIFTLTDVFILARDNTNPSSMPASGSMREGRVY